MTTKLSIEGITSYLWRNHSNWPQTVGACENDPSEDYKNLTHGFASGCYKCSECLVVDLAEALKDAGKSPSLAVDYYELIKQVKTVEREMGMGYVE